MLASAPREFNRRCFALLVLLISGVSAALCLSGCSILSQEDSSSYTPSLGPATVTPSPTLEIVPATPNPSPQPQIIPSPPIDSPTPTLVSPTPRPVTGSFIYVQHDNLFLYSDGETKQLIQDLTIISFDYHPETNQVAYVASHEKPRADATPSGPYSSASPSQTPTSISPSYPPTSAHLLDISTGQDTLILEPPTTYIPDSDYIRRLRDIAFAPDGKSLAITSTDSLWTYQIPTGELSQVFSFPVDNVYEGFVVYAYRDPLISPDNQYVVLDKRFYEGSQNAYAELSGQGQLTDIADYNAYIGGKQVISWRSARQLVVVEWTDTTSDQPPPQVSIQIVTFPSMAEVESFDFDGALYLAKVHHDSLFLLVTVKGPGSRVVNNLRLLDEHRLLYKLDLNTGTRLLLLDMIVNHENDNFIPFDLTVLDNRNLILAIYHVIRAPDPGISQLYVLDHSVPSSTPSLIIPDAWLTAQA